MPSNAKPMIVIGKEQQHFRLDRGLRPAAIVEPGSHVTFVTMDACCDEVRSVSDFLARRKSARQSNPLTGPIFVNGAEPGDTLVVEVIGIKLGAEGFQVLGPNRGIVVDEVREWSCHIVRIVENQIRFPNGLTLPVDPVIGTFGNAPGGEATFHAGRCGGNLDAPAARVGARLYIPVEVNGALFSLGDVHACQGDGEVVGAPEIAATVTVRIDVLKYKHADWCMIEDTDEWCSICAAETEAMAARAAVFQNAKFVERTTRMTFADALVILTMCGRISICRTGNWGNQQPVVSSSFPKAKLELALSRYQFAASAPEVKISA